MDRKSFFKLLPGLFAVKEIAKHLDALPIPEPVGSKGLYYQIRQGGNIVTYNVTTFTIDDLKMVIADMFYGKSLKERELMPMQVGGTAYEIALKEGFLSPENLIFDSSPPLSWE